MRRLIFLVLLTFCVYASQVTVIQAEDSPTKPKRPQAGKMQRVLLLWQSNDGHPYSTHEYLAGMKVVGHLLRDVPNLQVLPVNADSPWTEGPELLENADAVVMFVSQGAKWIQETPERIAAFEKLGKRGGGFSVLHWGMGTKDADDIKRFVNLFGGCHGGPDRKYLFLNTTMEPATPKHPVCAGLKKLELKEEFYYQLKFPKVGNPVTPIINAEIKGETYPVAWAWQRNEKGRSFGFSGCHFHENWKHDTYRRLVKQGILWTLHREIPQGGIADVSITPEILKLPPEPVKTSKP